MDSRPALTGAADTMTVVVDQAVFTSIRSPTGNGYRLIAASRGISADERKEITRTAPSHQSLQDDADGARGLASFVLESGRRCLYLSHNAGREYSGRGGCRVCTHVLVMDEDGYRRFDCHPLMIEAATVDAVGDAPARTAGGSLKPVELHAPTSHVPAWPVAGPLPPPTVTQRMERLLAAVSGGERLLVAHAPAQREMLCWLLSALPVTTREPLSLSCGMRFVPGRRYQLMLANVDRGSAGAAVAEEGITVFDWVLPEPLDEADVTAWAASIRQREPLAAPPAEVWPATQDGSETADARKHPTPAVPMMPWGAFPGAGRPPGRRRFN